MKENFDFSCWVIKYGRISIRGMTYKKDSLKNNSNQMVPLCWNHKHNDPSSVIGHALLENREDGVFAYCTLVDSPIKETIIQLIRDRGTVSLSPYINGVKIEGKYIADGIIREVSLVPVRIDQDESYYPVMKQDDI